MDIGANHKLCDPSNLEAGKTKSLDGLYVLTKKAFIYWEPLSPGLGPG